MDSAGVPQESVRSPLFLLYINDIVHVVNFSPSKTKSLIINSKHDAQLNPRISLSDKQQPS